MKHFTLILLCVLFNSVYAEEVYQWRGKDGVMNFGDIPHKGAEKIVIPEAQSYSPAQRPAEKPSGDNSALAKRVDYKQLTITSPTNDTTIRNNQGTVNISVELSPKLAGDDELQLSLDGVNVGKPQKTQQFILNNVDRGSHSLSVTLLRDGQSLLTSEPVTFFVHRAIARK